MLSKGGVDKSSLGTWTGSSLDAQPHGDEGQRREYPVPLELGRRRRRISLRLRGPDRAVFRRHAVDSAGKPGLIVGRCRCGAGVHEVGRIDQGLTNPASMESLEDDVRKSMSAGSSALGLNWTYMYAQANDPKESKEAGKITISPVPDGGGGRISVNGSMALTITAGSKHQDAAWTYVQYLSSKPVQEQYVTDSLPIWSPPTRTRRWSRAPPTWWPRPRSSWPT
jgi:multiple sugar transport system substrate-binding protein